MRGDKRRTANYQVFVASASGAHHVEVRRLDALSSGEKQVTDEGVQMGRVRGGHGAGSGRRRSRGPPPQGQSLPAGAVPEP